ncbi:unnamed protein product, partial [Ectocarpus sp. 12 AP-2014]
MRDALGARNIYTAVLWRTGEKHIKSLVGYGRLALMPNQADKGVSSLLRATERYAMVWCRLDPCMYTKYCSLPLILHAAGEATYAAPAGSAATIATTAASFHRR